MNTSLTMFVGFYALIVAVFVMALFISKYYHLFQLRDKIIIEYLGLVTGIGTMVFFSFNYSNSNFFFLAMFPLLIVRGIYRLIRLYQLKGDRFTFKDKIIFKSLEMLAIAGMVSLYCFTSYKGNGWLIVAIPGMAIAWKLYSFIKLYRSAPKSEG